MYPIEDSLYVRKSRLQTAKGTGVWSCAETDTVHYPGKVNVRLRQAEKRLPARQAQYAVAVEDCIELTMEGEAPLVHCGPRFFAVTDYKKRIPMLGD